MINAARTANLCQSSCHLVLRLLSASDDLYQEKKPCLHNLKQLSPGTTKSGALFKLPAGLCRTGFLLLNRCGSTTNNSEGAINHIKRKDLRKACHDERAVTCFMPDMC